MILTQTKKRSRQLHVTVAVSCHGCLVHTTFTAFHKSIRWRRAASSKLIRLPPSSVQFIAQ